MQKLGWFELFLGSALIAWLILGFMAYAVITWIRGDIHYREVEKNYDSIILNRWFMNGWYWNTHLLLNILLRLKITADMITWAALVLGAFSAVMLAMGRFGSAAMLMTLTAFCDLLDGLLARKTNTSTLSGAILDSSIDRYVDFFLLFGIAILYRHSIALLLITLLALQGSFMVSYSSSKAEALNLNPPRGSMKRIERFGILTFGAIFATFSVISWETPAEYAGGIYVGYPLLFALGLVAVWANISAVQRLIFIASNMPEDDFSQKLNPGGK